MDDHFAPFTQMGHQYSLYASTYIHVGRGICYVSYKFFHTRSVGVLVLIYKQLLCHLCYVGVKHGLVH